jgi:hypothetical protein
MQIPLPVRVQYGVGPKIYLSLAHLWNEWYREYLEVKDYPRLMVRLEDLTFRPHKVVQRICTCVGGQLILNNNNNNNTNNASSSSGFEVPLDSAKSYGGHDNDEGRNNATTTLQAWIKYGHIRNYGEIFGSNQDLKAARDNLDQELMRVFGYQHPDETDTM